MICFTLSDFILYFKKHVGVTPGKYRKIENGFHGLKDRRKGLIDRRSGFEKGRSKAPSNAQINCGLESANRIAKMPEKRFGVHDRRKSYKKSY